MSCAKGALSPISHWQVGRPLLGRWPFQPTRVEEEAARWTLPRSSLPSYELSDPPSPLRIAARTRRVALAPLHHIDRPLQSRTGRPRGPTLPRHRSILVTQAFLLHLVAQFQLHRPCSSAPPLIWAAQFPPPIPAAQPPLLHAAPSIPPPVRPDPATPSIPHLPDELCGPTTV
ncbi:hypothetical protein SETIT_1G265200v2 [Setaria italica]|uniref:Uncharacterized protein n=1 Tax=Setaria italica TaxID=4555 RepID=A0A368PPH6_SETIT|nr:hypothetical protein SETIT_1G265200v2 [Setaria italica]